MGVTFFRGHPSNKLLFRDKILEASTTVLSNPQPTDNDETTRHPLTYGSDQGALEVRKVIADWLNEKQNIKDFAIHADHINLTNGASFGATSALIQCCPADYTRLAFAISPTYFLINQIFSDAGFTGRMRAVVESESGIDLEGLKQMLSEDSAANNALSSSDQGPLRFRYVLYIVPVFSNPGGYTLTTNEKRQLLELARAYNVLLLCDHVYDFLDYGEKPQLNSESLVSMDRATLPKGSFGNVIANGSFSKYLGPGLRVGWQECATPELAHHLSQSGANKSGGSPAHLNTFIVKELVQSREIDNVLSALNEAYGLRAKEYTAAMEEYFPSGTKIAGGKGGYFFWVIFPENYDVQAITEECDSLGIRLAPGIYFEVLGDERRWGQNCFRVSLSYHDSEEAVDAIRTWGKVARNHYRLA